MLSFRRCSVGFLCALGLVGQVLAATMTVSPATEAVPIGGSRTFVAMLSGAPTTAVTWAVNGVAGGNPVTGPVFVRGAQTGDTLAVRIEAIELDSPGVTRYRKEMIPLGHLFERDTVRVTPIVDGQVVFNQRIRIPISPMVGTIGTAPQMEALSSGRPGIHGGNMDVPDIASGATVYLPVYHPGGLLFVGDVHAAMADAEICNTAIEIRGRVTLSCTVRKGRPRAMTWPRVETAETIMAVASGTPLDGTLQAAFRDLLLWMEEEYGWDRGEAYLLATQVADGRICNSLAVRAIMPKRYL